MKYLIHTCLSAAFLLAGNLALAQPAPVAADTPTQVYLPKELVERYPTDSIKSNDVAERAVAEVTKTRADIEKRFAADQKTCYKEFFTTSCLDKIKEQRRLDLVSIKPIEIEANAFIRRAKVDERDRRLAEERGPYAGRDPQGLPPPDRGRIRPLLQVRLPEPRHLDRRRRADVAGLRPGRDVACGREREAARPGRAGLPRPGLDDSPPEALSREARLGSAAGHVHSVRRSHLLGRSRAFDRGLGRRRSVR